MKTTPRIKSNRMIPLAIITALFAVSNASSAKSYGETYTASIDIIECHDAELKKADKELNAVYNEAMKTRPAKEKQKLKTAQQAWLKYRDAGIAFMDQFSTAEVRQLLEKKREKIQSILKQFQEAPDHGGNWRYVINHNIAHLEADLTWTDSILKDLDGARI